MYVDHFRPILASFTRCPFRYPTKVIIIQKINIHMHSFLMALFILWVVGFCKCSVYCLLETKAKPVEFCAALRS